MNVCILRNQDLFLQPKNKRAGIVARFRKFYLGTYRESTKDLGPHTMQTNKIVGCSNISKTLKSWLDTVVYLGQIVVTSELWI